MQENNILDDLDLENQNELSGTNLQLIRGFLLNIVIQFGLWVLFFQLINRELSNENGLIDIVLFEMKRIDYMLNVIMVIVFLVLATGSFFYVQLSNGKYQTYRKMISLGLLFSICSCIEMSIVQNFQEGMPWYSTFVSHPFASSMLIFFQFLLVCGFLFLIKRKWIVVSLIFILASLLAMGFIH